MGGLLFQDVRFALRTLVKKPGFSAVIVGTLALGIGANTAIFSVVNSVLLKPLPFPDADRLVHVWESYPKGSRYQPGSDRGFIIVRPGTFFDWKVQSQAFDAISAYGWRSVLLTGSGKAETLHAHEVDDAFFDTLGVRPTLGRTFVPADFKSSETRIVILSDSLWRTRFGGDPGIVGKTAPLDDATYTVVGVMPEGFYPTRWETPRLWLPMTLDPVLKQSRVAWKFFTFARLKPNVSFDQAQRELDVISDRLTAAYPAHYDNMCAVLTPVSGYLFSQYEKLFYTLLGAVGLVLLIACANVANLLLARSSERAREFALRAALGASRQRLLRQLLTESLLLSGAGALLGTAVALVSVRPILALLPASSRVPRIQDTGLDWTVLAFTLCTAVAAGVLFGIVPALRASRPNLNESLKEAGRSGSAGVGSRRLGDLLIVSEVAISLVLLVGAGLLIRSFFRLMQTDPGFSPDRVLALSISVPSHRYGPYQTGGPNPGRVRLYEEIERRLQSLPGVKSVAVTGSLPLRHGPNPWSMHIEGKPAPPPNKDGYGGAARLKKTGLYNHGDVSIQRVTPGYFETFGIPLLRGRLFDTRDRVGAPLVALVNESNARKHFGTDDPVGKTIVLDMTSYFPRVTVAGVVADSKLNALDKEVYPQVFWPMAQWPAAGGWVAVRTNADPAAMAKAAQQTLREIDPDLPVSEVTTMNGVLADSLWRQRLTAVLLGTFAGLAALLGGAGIYGVFSYLVSRRTKELGVRLSLGATRGQILMLVLSSAMKLALIGVALGTAVALASGRLVRSWLTGIESHDAGTIAGVSCVLLLVALAASYVPAARATRIDPLTALRQE